MIPANCKRLASFRSILVDQLLDSTPARTFSGLNCETTSLLPQYNYTMNTKDEETAKFAKWTVNINMLIVC